MSVAIEELNEGDFVEFSCDSCGSHHFHIRGTMTSAGVEVFEVHCCKCDITVSTDDPGQLLN